LAGWCAGALRTLLLLCAGVATIGYARNIEPASFASTGPLDSLELLSLKHSVFSPREGAPGGIRALAQTPDGILWVATAVGLFRYDGARFDMSVSDRLPSPSVSSLLGEPNGDLWIGYTFGGVSLLRDGQLTRFDKSQLPAGTVVQFFRSSDGILWVATSTGLAKLTGSRWTPVGAVDGYPAEGPYWMGEANGQFLVLTPTANLSLAPHAARFEREPRSVAEQARYGVRGYSSWRPDLSHTAANEPGQTLIDSAGVLWVSDFQSLVRYRWKDRNSAIPTSDSFSTAEGLSGEVNTFFEDREGNIWAGTEKGLDRFEVPKLERLPVRQPLLHPLLIAGENNELWVGQARGEVFRFNGRAIPIPSLGDSVVAASRAHDGSVWVAGASGLFHYTRGAVDKIPLPTNIAAAAGLSLFQALAALGDDEIWLSVAKFGLLRWKNGEWDKPPAGLPTGAAIRLQVDARDRLWLTFPDNEIAILAHGQLTRLSASNGLAVGNVLALDVRAQHAWIAGDLGVQLLVGERFTPLRGVDGTNFRVASGILETQAGELWINAARGVYRIPKENVARVLSGTEKPVDFELFDWHDSLESPASVVRPGPTLLQTGDGHIWISREQDVWSVDPDHIRRNPVAPIVAIEGVVSAGTTYSPAAPVDLPRNGRNIRIDYTAALMRDPERVRFRYRLVGVDDDWQDAGQRRQAYYTNLNPGRYTFRVMAANCDGVWSRNSAELRLNVLPAFYERLWFRALCVVAAAALFLLIFFIRLAQVHGRYRLRLQERHAERERIARDIHDTLLQGIQALLFRLQVWELNPSVPEPLRQEISKVITQSIAIVVEGRERILMLRRTQAKPAELRQALMAIANEESSDGAPTVSIHVKGIADALTTDAFEQLVDIGREAIRNAYAHALAKHVTVTLCYRRQSLSMSVTDDGKGIDASTLQGSGGKGHFGLIGMSERARQLHAQFRIEKNNPSGTRIMVVVPARTAYRKIRSWQWRAGNGALNDASPMFE
jgi:signal transduction histidine kinase/ligand-binding sensor domain-containing protein